ncbi:phytanoyl-CoA dioxygenase family protein [Cellvibrio sp. pealriver]|uniref:phytanoyl-CoA dioxygenase family protein n=1 Tax=Cellvibrio sp. pealriver TaxID=1622269 RepID=UPI0009E258A4|nr:phytanoyl-CoA dioxygenase family protein [Cellvibrio sp. pealriver]
MLTPHQILEFKTNGYLVLPAFSTAQFCDEVVAFALGELHKQVMPIEFEADVQYPGAPASRAAEGGATARRLLMATARNPDLRAWATGQPLSVVLHQLLGATVYLSQAHHNCIMTKQPAFSSITGWHRDSRYWNFARADLVSAWLALGNEQAENGCLWVIPGSHKVEIDADQLDEKQFLKTDIQKNESILQQAIAVPLRQGDLLLFHSNLFHAAGKNTTDNTKFSMVFTYRSADNPPKPGTRSTSQPELLID